MTYIKYPCKCGHVNYWQIKTNIINEFRCSHCRKQIAYSNTHVIKWYVKEPNYGEWDVLTDRTYERMREREREILFGYGTGSAGYYFSGSSGTFTTSATTWR